MSSYLPVFEYLQELRKHWIDIQITISPADVDGSISVSTRQVLPDGNVLREFHIRWEDPTEIRTEYRWGISHIHDIKDHVFHGLGFTPLTEIQTIVQTCYGKEIAGGAYGRAPGGDYLSVMREYIFNELYGAIGRPLVYSPTGQTGLLYQQPERDFTDDEKAEAFAYMCFISEEIMLPNLTGAYQDKEFLPKTQASVLDQPELVTRLLPNIQWADEQKQLLRLIDNQGYSHTTRAYVNQSLENVSMRIRDEIFLFASSERLEERFGSMFSTKDYLLINNNCGQ